MAQRENKVFFQSGIQASQRFTDLKLVHVVADCLQREVMAVHVPE